MVTRSDLARKLAVCFNTEEARFLAQLLLEETSGKSGASLLADGGARLNDEQSDQLTHWIERLIDGEPWQYVLGWAPFDGLKIPVSSGVLIPRPETEELVALAANKVQGQNPAIWDACTGSGCIALALHKRFSQGKVVATDFYSQALSRATLNASLLHLPIKVLFHDALEPSRPQELSQLDLLISNPPYVLPEEAAAMADNVLDHEPHEALFVPEDDPLLFYAALARHGREALKQGGWLWFEGNEQLMAELVGLLQDFGFAQVTSHHDFRGKPRFASAQWLG